MVWVSVSILREITNCSAEKQVKNILGLIPPLNTYFLDPLNSCLAFAFLSLSGLSKNAYNTFFLSTLNCVLLSFVTVVADTPTAATPSANRKFTTCPFAFRNRHKFTPQPVKHSQLRRVHTGRLCVEICSAALWHCSHRCGQIEFHRHAVLICQNFLRWWRTVAFWRLSCIILQFILYLKNQYI